MTTGLKAKQVGSNNLQSCGSSLGMHGSLSFEHFGKDCNSVSPIASVGEKHLLKQEAGDWPSGYRSMCYLKGEEKRPC